MATTDAEVRAAVRRLIRVFARRRPGSRGRRLVQLLRHVRDGGAVRTGHVLLGISERSTTTAWSTLCRRHDLPCADRIRLAFRRPMPGDRARVEARQLERERRWAAVRESLERERAPALDWQGRPVANLPALPVAR